MLLDTSCIHNEQNISRKRLVDACNFGLQRNKKKNGYYRKNVWYHGHYHCLVENSENFMKADTLISVNITFRISRF